MTLVRPPIAFVLALSAGTLAGSACRQANGPCDLTSQCLDSEVCRSGWCRATCNADSDCRSDESCRDGACLSVLVETPDAGHDGARSDAAGRDTQTDAVVSDLPAADRRATDLTSRDIQGSDLATGDLAPGDTHGGSDRDASDGAQVDSGPSDTSPVEAGACSVANIYWDTIDRCAGNENCAIDMSSGLVSCVAGAPSGMPYQSCADAGQCPHGSTCASMDSLRCMPFCRLADMRCPDYDVGKPGLCMYQTSVPEIGLCERPWECNPVNDTGCPANDHCYRVTSWGNVCVDYLAGAGLNQSCAGDFECQATLYCDPPASRCRRLCTSAPNTCPAPQLCSGRDGIYGVCVAPPLDAGNESGSG